MTAFMCDIGPRLESMLKKGAKGAVHLFCEDDGGRLTVVDIVFYGEIRTVLELCSLEGCNFADQYPMINLWLKQVAKEIPQLCGYDDLLIQFAKQIHEISKQDSNELR